MSDIMILWEEIQEEKKNTKQNFNDDLVQGEMLSKETISFQEKINIFLLKFQHIKVKEKVIFYRLLSTMLNAGMPLLKGIWVLERQEKNIVFKNMLQRFLTELKEGKTLSECMDFYPASFSTAETGVVRSGEKTGKLNEVLTSLAEQVEKIASISGKLKAALIYPGMIMVVVVGVIMVMMTVVVPKLLEIFEDKASLPASTQLLIFLSHFFTNYWYLIILGIVIIFVWISFWKKTDGGKYNYDNIILSIPVFGAVIKKVILSKFARVFSGLIGSGVSVVESLKIVADAVGNEVYRQRILLLAENVKQGMKIWESLDGDKLFPDIMIQMIQVGEQTAKLDQTVVKVAEFYDEQVDNTIGSINKLLEPFIIVFLAVVVGFIAIAIMQPIMNLADTVAES
jgi:type IV pilus assembly protein PilC